MCGYAKPPAPVMTQTGVYAGFWVIGTGFCRLAAERIVAATLAPDRRKPMSDVPPPAGPTDPAAGLDPADETFLEDALLEAILFSEVIKFAKSTASEINED